MAAPALDYTYRYPFASELAETSRGPRLRLATCGGVIDHPHFFRGKLCQPQRAADLLRGLVQIVQARYHIPPAMLHRILLLADPVVTSSEEVLRFEAFSACCSTYGRVDLLPAGFDGEIVERGTTNVDFNAPMRAALARIRAGDEVGLSIGRGELELSRGSDAVVERKVALPVRWLKGFVEVQAYQSRMQRRLEVSGLEASRFFRGLPRGSMHAPAWVVPAGRGLRLSQVQSKTGVRVAGVQRLRVLEDLARHAQHLRVYADPATEASAWELVLPEARFHLVLSPEVWRGFSGEGQALADLASGQWQEILPRIQAALKWDAKIDAGELARKLDLPSDSIQAALAVLGSRGLVGFDLAEGTYYHRVLPFDLSLVEALQPRLKDARKLVADGGIRIIKQDGEIVEALVPGTDVEHRVRLTADAAKCTCPWYAKHQNERGPCKHVLAVQIMVEEKEGP